MVVKQPRTTDESSDQPEGEDAPPPGSKLDKLVFTFNIFNCLWLKEGCFEPPDIIRKKHIFTSPNQAHEEV